MKRHNSKIKRLSTAILRGYAMAKERGIKVARGSFIKENSRGEVTCACALGMAAIGLFGVETAKNYDENGVMFHLDLDEETISSCLYKFATPKMQTKVGITKDSSILDFVTVSNDTAKRNPDVIAEQLKSCKF